MEFMPSSIVQLANEITKVVVPIIIIVGVISNSLNIIVLTRPNLYKHACSRYFLAHASTNLFYLSIVTLLRLLSDQYQIDPARDSLISCKINMYVGQLGIFLAPSFIVLASIDRWCGSSTSTRLRSFSSVRTASWMIIATVILFGLFFINSAVLVDVRYTDPLGCSVRPDTPYKQVYVLIQICILSFVIPFLMALFGFLTIYNIKKARVLPATNTGDRRTGRQLSYMLLLQVSCHVILTLPSSITYLIYTIPNEIKATPEFFAATTLCMLPFHLAYITAFFLYILSSQLYRGELIRVKNKVLGRRGDNRIHPVSNTNAGRTITVQKNR